RDFLRAVRNNPFEPGELLVAADWLDENGHTLTAEFIRACIQLSTMGSGQERANSLARLAQIGEHVIGRQVDDRDDLLPRALAAPAGGRRTGDEFRLVGQQIQRRAGPKGPWTVDEGDPPQVVARQFLALLARDWMRPANERLSPTFYGDRTGRERMIRGQLQ